ncbi:MAG: FAD-binding protein [Candidatus Omnitrophica bacterium]|nr:FAD-binding protein [Candidatus Omnitrophota bacterium]
MIIKNKKEDLLTYLEDTSNLKGSACRVYLPKDKTELSKCILELKRQKIPFTASAGRTGTTGGCTPFGGAIISFEGFRKDIEVDLKDKTAKLSAGVSLDELETRINKLKLTLRASPTEPLALAVGTVSTAASGVRGFGYRGIRNYVKEIELCLADGELIKIKRGQILAKGRVFDFELKKRRFKFKLPSYAIPNCKSQAGYFMKDNLDLIDLFIGSEGTLGIIVSCVLSLQDIPYRAFDGLIFFSKEEDSLKFVSDIKALKQKRTIVPTSLEFFDANSLKLLKKEYSFIPEAAAAVYFEQEVEVVSDHERLIDKWQNLIEQSSALVEESIFADTAQEREKVFAIRHKLPQMINEFLRQSKQVKVASDIAVPESKFDQMYQDYRKIAKECGIDYVNFGHIGESHLHFNFLPKSDTESEQAKEYLKELCQRAVALGGTVSAEHGIGKIKKSYLKLMYSAEDIKGMARVKKYFDPDCLLGLDNIFDRELLKDL